MVAGPIIKGAPYSADLVTETTRVLADGNHIRLVVTVRVYRDSDGRTRREQRLDELIGTAAGAGLPPIVFIQDPVAGVSYTLHPDQHLARWRRLRTRPAPSPESPRPAPRMAPRGGPGGPGGGGRGWRREQLGRQNMEGLPVEGTRTVSTIPPGQAGNEQPLQVVDERWFSSELQTDVLIRRSDPRNGETVTRLTNISRAEPGHSLFERPQDYRRVEGRQGGGPIPPPDGRD
jgi:hypothetical protein